MRRFSSPGILIGILLTAIGSLSFTVQKRPAWIAPASANDLINPFAGNANATASGKILFTNHCVACHGPKGKGDGIAGIALNPTPANLSSQKVQSQTDGALYWKITEGNLPMASYKSTLTEEQRWQLVNYIRELNASNPKKSP